MIFLSILSIGLCILNIALYALLKTKVDDLYEHIDFIELKVSQSTREYETRLNSTETELYQYVGANNKDVFQTIDKISKELAKTNNIVEKFMVDEREGDVTPKLTRKRKKS